MFCVRKVYRAIRERTYPADNNEATNDATPATIIVALVSFSPVPRDMSWKRAMITPASISYAEASSKSRMSPYESAHLLKLTYLSP